MDWHSILIKYGVEVSHEIEFNIHCPFHDDRRQSCSINIDKGVWICFAGCGQGGLAYFIKKLSGKSWAEINKEFDNESIDIDYDSLFDSFTIEDSPKENFSEYPSDLNEVPNDHWIYKRGFTKESIDKWDCKCNSYNDLVIPVKDSDDIVSGWITRRIQATPKYLFSKGFQKSKYLFGMNNLSNIDVLFVVEGALDAMWLDQYNYPSVAILGAIISKSQIDLLGSLNPTEVVLALDNDEAGKRGIHKATFDLNNKFMLSYIKLPKNIKDVQEIRNIKDINKIIKTRSLW